MPDPENLGEMPPPLFGLVANPVDGGEYELRWNRWT